MQMINLAMTSKRRKNNKPVRLSFAETPSIPINIEPSSADKVASNVDLLMDILSRLPTRLLVRSMCVSQEWTTLIRNPTFQKLRNPNPEPPSGLFIAVSKNEYAKCEFVPYDIGNPVKPPPLTPNFDPEANIFFIRNAVNGLFLCTGLRGKDYVYNPTINQFSKLPIRDTDSYLLGMSIAFDPSISPHYKIAYVYFLEERIFEIRVYSSETHTCKTACIVNLDYDISNTPIKMEFKGGVYWNNAVHWISDHRFVLYFNFDRELIHKISTPSVRKNLNYIFESRGHFLDVEMSDPVDSTLKIHELKRDYSEWFVKYIVNLKELGWSFPRLFRRGSPVALQTAVLDLVLGEKDDDSFLVLEIPWTVVRYNLVSKTFHKLHDFTTYPNCSRPMKGQSPILRWPLAYQFREFIFSL
uniref:F-box domain-containing protein n=1 Tax=Tanacetum cinerariifolium TaxID=118510 RepID=A0A6L2KUL5_TANCI|nr:hypothetical protein [Tanacetum cinerariifolium]